MCSSSAASTRTAIRVASLKVAPGYKEVATFRPDEHGLHRLRAAEWHGYVFVDLSGTVKTFVVDHDRVVGIRAMTHGDLVDVTRWRQSEHVRKWVWLTADG